MNTTEDLQKKLDQQAELIKQLKRAIQLLEQKLILVDKKASRANEKTIQLKNDVTKLGSMLRRVD